jgi:hypothetical protein
MHRTNYVYVIYIFGQERSILELFQATLVGPAERRSCPGSIWMDRARQAGAPGSETLSISPILRALGNTLRVAFIVCLLVLTVRVSMPQNETIWTAYDTPGDLVRLALGFAVCVWVAIQLFRAPKDANGYRMWTYFGLIGVPFAIICLIATW